MQTPNQFNSIVPLYKSFKESGILKPIILVTGFKHDLNLMNQKNDCIVLLSKMSIEYIVDRVNIIEKEAPAVVIYFSPYDSTRSIKLHSRWVRKFTQIQCYVPYGFEIVKTRYLTRMNFKEAFYKNINLIIARSYSHKQMYIKYGRINPNYILVTGNPRFDYLREYTTNESKTAIEYISQEGKQTYLWNPHWSIIPGILSWSSFFVYYDTIINYFVKNPDKLLIIRPHPHFWGAIKKLWDSNRIYEFETITRKYPNILIDRSGDYSWLLKIIDILLSDPSSLIMEFLPTQKPICVLIKDDKVKFNDDGALINYLYTVRTNEELKSVLEFLSNGNDPKKDKRYYAIKEFIYEPYTSCSDRIVNYIIDKYK